MYNSSDYLDQDGKLVENLTDNLYSPVSLAILSQKYNFYYVYVGTGCIFEYDEEHPFASEERGYDEDSRPNFFGSSYSTVKGITDMLMHYFEDTTLNVRIRMPISSKPSRGNFITKLLGYKKISSTPNSMTFLDELLPVLVNMIINKEKGTINLTNPGLITNDEILHHYKEIVDPEFTWETFTTEEQNKLLGSKKSNNYLDTKKLEKIAHIDNINIIKVIFLR